MQDWGREGRRWLWRRGGGASGSPRRRAAEVGAGHCCQEAWRIISQEAIYAAGIDAELLVLPLHGGSQPHTTHLHLNMTELANWRIGLLQTLQPHWCTSECPKGCLNTGL